MSDMLLGGEILAAPEPPPAVDRAIREAGRLRAAELAARPARHRWSGLLRYGKFAAMLLGLVSFLQLYQGCTLKSVPQKNDQMIPSYHPGKDLLVIDRQVHSEGTGLKQGDAVVYEHSSRATKGGEPPVFMGRVIAFGGQRVAVKAGEIYVNGARISEAGYLEDDSRDSFSMPEIVIPRGHVFLLVDNRGGFRELRFQTRMRDSRHLGPIKEWAIIGKIQDRFRYGKGS